MKDWRFLGLSGWMKGWLLDHVSTLLILVISSIPVHNLYFLPVFVKMVYFISNFFESLIYQVLINFFLPWCVSHFETISWSWALLRTHNCKDLLKLLSSDILFLELVADLAGQDMCLLCIVLLYLWFFFSHLRLFYHIVVCLWHVIPVLF